MNRASISLPSARQRQRGVTLVELLVAMAIGLVVILAVTSTVIFGESQRRTTTGGNDMSQSGAFAAYAFDQALRSAGSGFVQSAGYGGLGCKLNVSYGGNVTQPRSAPFPAPFAGFVPGAVSDLRMAPVVIGKNQSAGGSDVLMVMGGNAASGAVPRPVRSAGAGTNELRLDNTVGLMPNELGLLIQPGAPTICVVEQVGSGALGKEVVTLADNTPDTYLATSAGGSSLSAIAGSTTALYTTLGSSAAGNAQLQLFGVDANRQLFSYDMLRSTKASSTAAEDQTSGALQAIVDGVGELHAIYGVDTTPTPDGIVDAWVDPSGATWGAAAVMANPMSQRRIIAVRVALVMRSAVFEKEVVTTARPALFADTPAAIAAAPITGDDQHFRLRVVDTTIPLRNVPLAPLPPP